MLFFVEKDKPINFELHPAKQQQNTYLTTLLKDNEMDVVLEKAENYNTIIAENQLLHKTWEELIEEKRNRYFNYISPINNTSNKFLRAAFFKQV